MCSWKNSMVVAILKTLLISFWRSALYKDIGERLKFRDENILLFFLLNMLDTYLTFKVFGMFDG